MVSWVFLLMIQKRKDLAFAKSFLLRPLGLIMILGFRPSIGHMFSGTRYIQRA